jgi:hypothetical protein
MPKLTVTQNRLPIQGAENPKSNGVAGKIRGPDEVEYVFLDPKDCQNLKDSGLTDETIRKSEIYTETDPKVIAKLLNKKKAVIQRAMVIPYIDLEGRSSYHRLRPHDSRKDKEGKTIRYESPYGLPMQAYLVPWITSTEYLDTSNALYVVEGEKKALAVAQAGYLAVGIGGIWCWKISKGPILPDLEQLVGNGRRVYLVFDSESEERKQQENERAKQALAAELQRVGAGHVFSIDLPLSADGGKNGADDFLVANRPNGARAFRKLVENAIPLTAGRSIPSIDLICLTEPTLGEDAYHGFMGKFVRAISPLTEATDACLLFQLIPALGARIGHNFYYTTGAEQPPKYFVVIVGPSAWGRKGTGLSPVEKVMCKATGFKGLYVRGLSSGEGLIAALKERNEGEKNEYRTLNIEEEFGRVLIQGKRTENILSQVLRQLYDGEAVSVLTKDAVEVEGVHFCQLGHITPAELRKRLSQLSTLDGFANRYLWPYVRTEKRIPRVKPIPDDVVQPLVEDLNRIFKWVLEKTMTVVPVTLPGNQKEDTAVPLQSVETHKVEVTMNEEAATLWDTEYGEVLKERSNSYTNDLCARAQTHVIRLALLYAILDRSLFITLPHLKAALAVWKVIV